MKTYAAMPILSHPYRRALNEARYPQVLASFAFHEATDFEEVLGYSDFALMLDSGAHSVWKRGKTIDIDAYIAWAFTCAEKHPEVRVTNLDVIPGEHGRYFPSRAEIARAVAQSAENADTIRAAGLRVCEVHHYVDPIESLSAILDRRQPGEAVGIGGFAEMKRGVGGLNTFGDTVFAVLRDRYGWHDLPPLHGFGSSGQIGYRYPLASVDSSSWTSPCVYGTKFRGGKFHMTQKQPIRYRDKSYDLANVEMRNVLDWWLARDREVTELWEKRGVRFQVEGALA